MFKRFLKLSLKLRLTILVVLAFIVLLFVLGMMNEFDRIFELYNSVSTKTTDSKATFDKRLHFVTKNEDGTYKITLGFQSETEYEAAQQRFGDVLDDGEANDSVDTPSGAGGGNTNPSSNGVFERLADVIDSYNLDGSETGISCSNGQEFPTYNGIPAEWNWDSSTDVVVWHYRNTADAWVENFGEETGQSTILTYDQLNKEHSRSDLTNYENVQCLQICSTAALVRGEFTPSNTPGVNDVYESSQGFEGVIIVQDTTNDSYLYIPCYVTDAKAHTYPGGIVQTQCARYSNFDACYDEDTDACGDFGNRPPGIHASDGHYVYTDRPISVEIESNWTSQPIKDNWKIIDVLLRVS